MFKKYYKEANDDIKADEKLINSVIQNVKKRKPKSLYIRYGVTAAAAVAVVSAAVISMPVWQRTNDNKDGVIIEERVTQTSKPDSIKPDNIKPDSMPVVSSPPSIMQKEENAAENTRKNTALKNIVSEEKNYNRGENVFSDSISSAVSEKSNVSDIGDAADKTEGSDKNIGGDIALFSAILPKKQSDTAAIDDAGVINNTAEFRASMAIAPDSAGDDAAEEAQTDALLGSALPEGIADTAAGQITADSAGDTDIQDNSVSYKKTMGSASSNAAVRVPHAEGFWITEFGNGMQVFENDSGGTISVTTEYVQGGDSAPVYTYGGNEIYVTLTANGVRYSITASGTEREKVIEFVNSILY